MKVFCRTCFLSNFTVRHYWVIDRLLISFGNNRHKMSCRGYSTWAFDYMNNLLFVKAKIKLTESLRITTNSRYFPIKRLFQALLFLEFNLFICWSLQMKHRDPVTLPQILKQNPGFSSYCNENYVGQSGTLWLLQLSRYLWLEIETKFCVFLTVFITLQSIGENEHGKTGHSKIVIFLRALTGINHCEAWFFLLGLQYYTISQTLIKYM